MSTRSDNVSLRDLCLQMLQRPTGITNANFPSRLGTLLDESASIFRVGVNYHFNRSASGAALRRFQLKGISTSV